MTERKAFNFYYSHWEQIKLLKNNQKLQLFTKICEVQFLELNINDVKFEDSTLNLVWTGLKHSIETSLNGYIAKQKSLGNQVVEPLAKGVAKGVAKQGGCVAPCQQEKEEGKEEEEGKEKLSIPEFSEFKEYALENKPKVDLNDLKLKYESWKVNGWKTGKDKPIKNWKNTLLNTLSYIKESNNTQQSSGKLWG